MSTRQLSGSCLDASGECEHQDPSTLPNFTTPFPLRTSGQICTATSRLLVNKAITKIFLDKLKVRGYDWI